MAEKEKIALCLEYPIGQFGGTEILVREIIRGLGDRYRITLVSGDDENQIGKSSVIDKLDRHITWKAAEISTAASQRLAQNLFEGGVKLAHFHFGGSYAWGNRYFQKSPIYFVDRLGIPCLSTNHGAFSIFDGYCGPQRSWLVKGMLLPPAWLNKMKVISRLKTEIAVSKHDFHALRRWYFPVRSKFSQLYHSQLHLSQINDTPVPAAQRTKSIICVGTIGLRKGQPVLAEAFSRIAADFPDWQLVLIGRHGDEVLVEQIKHIISRDQLSGKILMLDKCSNAEVDRWMRTSAIFAMPSFFEGLGLSLQGALFHGCACIGSSAGGITDLIENDSNGILVERGNVEQLAQGLRRLMANDNLRELFGRQARQSIIQKEMFTEKMAESYDRIYQKILSPDKPL